MSQRIYVTPSAFKVSKPGFDAASAAETNLLFDAFRGQYNGCLMKGFVTGPAGGGWTIISAGIFSFTVNYGKTFATAPKIFWGAFDPNTGAFTPTYSGAGSGGQLKVYVSIGTSSVTFFCNSSGTPPVGLATSFGLCYFIFIA